jgi:hypothetical protein
MAPVMTWVVETGMPSAEDENIVNAPAVSVAKPPNGKTLSILTTSVPGFSELFDLTGDDEHGPFTDIGNAVREALKVMRRP